MEHDPLTPEKQLLALRFARARSTYEREAHVQRKATERLMRLLISVLTERGVNDDQRPAYFHHIVEIGCGTGRLSRLLCREFKPNTLLLNDLCPDMKHSLADLLRLPFVSFTPGDGELTDFARGTDLIISCSTLQWFTHPADFFRRCHQGLTEGGMLALSTFGIDNLREIRALTGKGLNYLTINQLRDMLTPYFHLLRCEEERTTLAFDSPIHMLRHLKSTGATTNSTSPTTGPTLSTPQRLNDFNTAYLSHFANDDGRVRLTYHPIYLVGVKKNDG